MPKSKAEPGRSWWMSDAGYKSYLASKPYKPPTYSQLKKAEAAALKAYRKRNPEFAAAADAMDAAREIYEQSEAYRAFNAVRTPEARKILDASEAGKAYDKAFFEYLRKVHGNKPSTETSLPAKAPPRKSSPASEKRAQVRRSAFHVVGSK